MNLYSSTRETFRRSIERHRTARPPEKRTYVFVFVPVDFRKNGHPTKFDIVNAGTNERRLDDELMWTWFLPNPLSSEKEQK